MFKNIKNLDKLFAMENFEETSPENHEEPAAIQLVVTEDIRSYLYDMSKWTKFLSILGFVFTAFLVMFAFGSGAFIQVLAKVSPGNPFLAMGTGFVTIYFLLIALLYFYPSLLMFRQSNATQKAVLYGDQASLSVAMSSLKSFFRFWGILMIVIIVFYGLAIVSFLLGGAAAAGH